MTTALIADDEPHLLKSLQTQLLALWPDLQIVATARNGIEAAEHIATLQPDLAFLDIQMPGLTGLEVAQGIEGHTRVVFVTAYDEYAVQAFEQEAIDYVLKPVKALRLQRTLERVRRAQATSAPANDPALLAALQRLLPQASSSTGHERLRWVRASRGEVTQQVAIEDVLYFHADDKYTCVRTAGGEHLIRTPIVELAAQLDPAVFQQIHRSTLINMQHLESTRRDEASRLFVRMRGQSEELPVSRAYVHLFKAM
jgi:DNA-binding LytR/AlgR family response regulator